MITGSEVAAVRKRMVQIPFRLTKEEAEMLEERVRKSGLTREAYLRQLIRGAVPREAPPLDYFAMMKELRSIGNNLNQIARKAHALQVLDERRYDEAVKLFEDTVRKITEAVILPISLASLQGEGKRT